jgi:hypothetical protein
MLCWNLFGWHFDFFVYSSKASWNNISVVRLPIHQFNFLKNGSDGRSIFRHNSHYYYFFLVGSVFFLALFVFGALSLQRHATL